MSSVFINNVDTVLGTCLLEELAPLYDTVHATVTKPSPQYEHLHLVSVTST